MTQDIHLRQELTEAEYLWKIAFDELQIAVKKGPSYKIPKYSAKYKSLYN